MPGGGDAFYKKLHEAFEELQWQEHKLEPDGLRNYKNIIEKLFHVAHEKHEMPPDYAWDRPYRALSVADLKDLCVERGLMSALGAAASSKKDLIIALAFADHAAFDSEYK